MYDATDDDDEDDGYDRPRGEDEEEEEKGGGEEKGGDEEKVGGSSKVRRRHTRVPSLSARAVGWPRLMRGGDVASSGSMARDRVSIVRHIGRVVSLVLLSRVVSVAALLLVAALV